MKYKTAGSWYLRQTTLYPVKTHEMALYFEFIFAMARVGFSSLNVNQMAGNKGMIAVCLRSRQQERSRNGPLDLVETHNNQQLQRQQRAVPFGETV